MRKGSKKISGIDNPENYIIGTQEFVPANNLGMRDREFTEFVSEYKKHYARKSKQNRRLKETFFWIITTLLGAFLACVLVFIGVLIHKGINTSGDIGVIITALASVLTGLIALPLVIVKYLFPPKEDKDLLLFMSEIMRIDKSVENSIIEDEEE